MDHTQRGRDEGMSGNDDLISTADPRRLQREHQSGSARGDADGIGNIAKCGKFSFEALDLVSKGEGARAKQATENRGQFFGERIVLAGEGNERDRRSGVAGYVGTLLVRV